jgi:hypothetical protein
MERRGGGIQTARELRRVSVGKLPCDGENNNQPQDLDEGGAVSRQHHSLPSWPVLPPPLPTKARQHAWVGGRGSSVDGVGRSTTTTTTWVVPSFPGRGSCPSRGSSVSLCGSGGHICGRGKGRRVYHLAMITRDDIEGSDGVDRATIATSGGAEYRRRWHIMQRR